MGGIGALLVAVFLVLLPATGEAAAPTAGGKTRNRVHFHRTPIAAGSSLWFSSVFDFCDTLSVPTRAWHFRFTDSRITFRGNGVRYEIPVPDAEVTIDPNAASAVTIFGADGKWHTIVPAGFSGNVFLSGVPFQAPVDFDGKHGSAVWTGTVTSDVPDVSIEWRWGAAVYDVLGTPEELVVNPLDGTTPAGTPQAFVSHLLAGGTSTCPPQSTGQLGRGRCVAPMTVDCTADTSVCSVTCNAECDPVCEPPRCSTQCKEPPPATCDVKCEKPVCEIQCSDGVDCSGGEGLCPHCTTVCLPPHCVTHCQAPRPECVAVCEEAQCQWNCRAADGADACTIEEIGGIACTAPTWRDDICN